LADEGDAGGVLMGMGGVDTGVGVAVDVGARPYDTDNFV